MTIPNKGWLPTPLNSNVTTFTLPVEFPVYYYVCNPGPYDPLQPYELPLIRSIELNQIPFADSGYKNGAWGWVTGIHWLFAYGDALIDWVYPPLDPTSFDDPCPDNVEDNDDACPPAFTLVTEPETSPTVTQEASAANSVTDDRPSNSTFQGDVGSSITITSDDKPA